MKSAKGKTGTVKIFFLITRHLPSLGWRPGFGRHFEEQVKGAAPGQAESLRKVRSYS